MAARRRVPLQAHFQYLRCRNAELEIAVGVVEVEQRYIPCIEAVAQVVYDRAHAAFALVEPAFVYAGEAAVRVAQDGGATKPLLLLGDVGPCCGSAALQFARRSLCEELFYGDVRLVYVVVVDESAGALALGPLLERRSVLTEDDAGTEPLHATVEDDISCSRRRQPSRRQGVAARTRRSRDRRPPHPNHG